MDGILNIYKESGYTSHDVVARLRGICRQKKIGHTGTLDPDAIGVLPICMGKATKVCDVLTNKDKTYEATVLLGITTDTQDISGKVISERPVAVSEETLRQVILDFVGHSKQIPPMYSAVKVKGKRCYEMARQGIEIERAARDIIIYKIDNLNMSLEINEFRMTVHCGKGTYIRTLCHDIGEKLGCGAVMKSLVRTKVSSFCIEEAIKLDEAEKMFLEGTLESKIIKIDEVFLHYRKATIIDEATKYLQNGNVLYENQILLENQQSEEISIGEYIRVYDTFDEFIALYEFQGVNKGYKIIKMFSISVPSKGAILCIGKFDGMHLGHQMLIHFTTEEAKKKSLSSIMFTFLSLQEDVIYEENEKLILARELGIDKYIAHPFTDEFKKMNPEEFVRDHLIKKYNAKSIVVGEDFRFGYERKGDVKLLNKLSKKYNFELKCFSSKNYKEEKISSSRIRNELITGKIEEVNEMLGQPYFIKGTVVEGNKIGRTLDMPTVNLISSTTKVLPQNGVYASVVTFGGKKIYGVTNIGEKPTIPGENQHGVETYLFDFDEEIYGQEICVELLQFIRPEMKFSSLDELKKNMFSDKEKVQQWLNSKKSKDCHD